MRGVRRFPRDDIPRPGGVIPGRRCLAAAPIGVATSTVLADGVAARLRESGAPPRKVEPTLPRSGLDALRLPTGFDAPSDPGAARGREDLRFRERADWRYLTAHPLGDMQRLVRQCGRAVADVYPAGEYFKGGNDGADVVFPVSADERNTPKFQGCMDRNP